MHPDRRKQKIFYARATADSDGHTKSTTTTSKPLSMEEIAKGAREALNYIRDNELNQLSDQFIIGFITSIEEFATSAQGDNPAILKMQQAIEKIAAATEGMSSKITKIESTISSSSSVTPAQAAGFWGVRDWDVSKGPPPPLISNTLRCVVLPRCR